jgi:hypothetical protein
MYKCEIQRIQWRVGDVHVHVMHVGQGADGSCEDRNIQHPTSNIENRSADWFPLMGFHWTIPLLTGRAGKTAAGW